MESPDSVLNAEESILRVSASTSPQELAAAIAHGCYEGKPPTLRAIGAGAVNQAIKACAVARQYVGPRAMDLTFRPGFTTLSMHDNANVSAIVLKVIID